MLKISWKSERNWESCESFKLVLVSQLPVDRVEVKPNGYFQMFCTSILNHAFVPQ